jgi:deoxyribodipyrimidine photo-lyase
MTVLPNPNSGQEVSWVRAHLGHLCSDDPQASPRFRGTQAAADAALNAFNVAGYAGRRNEVLPRSRRGASGLSPWIRHGLLTLPQVWEHVSGPSKDVAKFHDELLWQEYSRHVYARLGSSMQNPIRYEPRSQVRVVGEPWNRSMACVDSTLSELESDGWMVNQTRMWLASQWTVRHGAHWRDGEDHFFRHLLDGSRAANRLGWQWTIGAGTGKAYGFSRWQVEKRTSGLCDSCVHRHSCPIERWPAETALDGVAANPLIRSMPSTELERVRGPLNTVRSGEPEAVWITAESLGESDPALAAHKDLRAIFVFDEPLLRGLMLSGKRLVFLAERLAELASDRSLTIELGNPTEVLAGTAVATTFAPVPGWQRRANAIQPIEIHPWPWLRKPSGNSVASFSAWRDVKR